MNKSAAFDFAKKTISELNGNWVNKTFNNLGWVVRIDSADSKEISLIYNEYENNWTVYVLPHGYSGTAQTAQQALIKAAYATQKQLKELQENLKEKQAIHNILLKG